VDLLVQKNLQVPMRDGVNLATDVYRPAAEGRYPTIVSRLPYDKELPIVNFSFDTMRAARAGYAVVVQDTRGRYQSDGVFTAFADEAEDGADTIAWAAAQPWSTGEVGMVGGSYFGATQWLAASQAPPALRAIAPFVTTDQYYESWAYQGGAFQLGFNLHWSLLSLGLGELLRQVGAGQAKPERFAELVEAIDDNDALYRRLPLTDMPELAGLADYYQDWLAHPSYDGYWKATAPRESWDRITVPALNMGGWYDLFLKGTIANYLGMKENGGSEQARELQRLVIGPWAHGPMSGWYPQRGFGLLSGTDAHDITGLQLRWFDQLLRGEDRGLEADKPVQIFVMGADEWRDEDDWPLPGTEYVDWFLTSDGRANTAAGDGRLSADGPVESPDDVYLYDPRDPVPTVGGATFLPGLFAGVNAGPRDQREVERRADVLSYTSVPLPEPLTVIGPVELVLHASSSALDTDFTAKLVDVAPDGSAVNLADGILRARYRDSLSEPAPLEPGHVYELRIDLVATANVFAAGHRIRLDVSSSNFPRFDRNTNTGGTIASEAIDDLVQAVNRVHHTPAYPSRLVLPVIRY
jgi:putative CocE/NonD family hydrolase